MTMNSFVAEVTFKLYFRIKFKLLRTFSIGNTPNDILEVIWLTLPPSPTKIKS